MSRDYKQGEIYHASIIQYCPKSCFGKVRGLKTEKDLLVVSEMFDFDQVLRKHDRTLQSFY